MYFISDQLQGYYLGTYLFGREIPLVSQNWFIPLVLDLNTFFCRPTVYLCIPPGVFWKRYPLTPYSKCSSNNCILKLYSIISKYYFPILLPLHFKTNQLLTWFFQLTNVFEPLIFFNFLWCLLLVQFH